MTDNTVYPTHKLYAWLNGVRTDITGDVVDNISGGWGFNDNKELERVAPVGWLKFLLLDPTRKYVPDSAAPLSGWDIGTVIELEITYRITRKLRFYVKKVTPPKDVGASRTEVDCVDWMDYAAGHPVDNPGMLTNQRGDDVLQITLTLGIIVPQNTQFDVGAEVFQTTFDTVTSQTKVYDEMVKVALSELGWIYLQKDPTYGETLVFENGSHRSGVSALTQVPTPLSTPSYILKADNSGYILKAQDSGKLIINSATDAIFMDSMEKFETRYGDYVVNYATAWAYPRRKDTATQTMFKLDQSILIGPGDTYTFRGTYSDPAGGLPINANPSDMITPVATTDFLFNSKADGTGTNLTANLSVNSITFGTEGFTVTLKSSAGSVGYVTKFNVRGLGIYYYNPISSQATNSESYNKYGVFSETLEQKYKVDLTAGKLFVQRLVNAARRPKSDLKSITALCNRSELLMLLFLKLDVGSTVRIQISEIGLDGYYFIQGVEEFTLTPAGVIRCKWIVKLQLNLGAFGSLSPIAIDSNNTGLTGLAQAIDFGYVPGIAGDDVTSFTWCCWVYLLSWATPFQLLMLVSVPNGGEIYFAVLSDGKLDFETIKFDDDSGLWKTTSATVPQDQWVHLAVTWKISLTDTPTLYINGVSQAVTTTQSPTGTFLSGLGSHFITGGLRGYSDDSMNYGIDGKLKDVRVYKNRILTASEILQIVNGGVPSPVAGPLTDLAFQGFFVAQPDYSSYVDHALSESMPVLDKVFYYAGTPRNSPTGRSA